MMYFHCPCLRSAPFTLICREALAKARAARLQVLEKMRAALPAPRPEISPFAKTGGLGEVLGSLPAALERLGIFPWSL